MPGPAALGGPGPAGGAGLPGQALLLGAGHQVGLAVGDELADQVGMHRDHLAPGSFQVPRHDPALGSSGRSVMDTPRRRQTWRPRAAQFAPRALYIPGESAT